MPTAHLESGNTVNIIVEGNSEPAIVFLAGLGDPADWWFTVPTSEEARPHWNGHSTSPSGRPGLAASLASTARVVAYDRAGVGRSAAPDHERTWQELYTELEAVIQSLNLACPPVLVGHSLGGLLAYTYARRHRKQIGGLVLLDPTPPPLHPWPHGPSPERLALTHFEMSELAQHALADLPLALIAPGRAATAAEVTWQQPAAFQDDLDTRFQQRHAQQAKLLKTSGRSQAIWTSGAGHYVHLDNPGAVRPAILAVWEAASTL